MNATRRQQLLLAERRPGLLDVDRLGRTPRSRRCCSTTTTCRAASSNAVSARPQISINADGESAVKATVTNNDIKSAAGAEIILNTLAEPHRHLRREGQQQRHRRRPAGRPRRAGRRRYVHLGLGARRRRQPDGDPQQHRRRTGAGARMELSLNNGNGDADYTVTGNTFSNPERPVVTPLRRCTSSRARPVATRATSASTGEQRHRRHRSQRRARHRARPSHAGSFLRFADFNGTIASALNLRDNLRSKNPLSPALTVETFSARRTATTDTACDLPVGTP